MQSKVILLHKAKHTRLALGFMLAAKHAKHVCMYVCMFENHVFYRQN